jgi:hypothetical protein
MAGRTFTRAEKATAITLARMTSVDAAAATLTIDRRTLRGWVAAAPPPTDDDAWLAAEALAQQQLLTSLAAGKVKQPNLIAVVAGIATDKLWRRRRWREREARKAAEAEVEQPERSRTRELIDELPNERTRYLRDELDYLLAQPEELSTESTKPEAEWEDEWCRHLEWVRDLSLDDFAKERTALDELRAVQEVQWREEQEARWRPKQESPFPAEPTPEPAEPIRLDRSRPPPEPSVVVLPMGEHLDDHPTWTPVWTDDSWHR